MSNEIILSEDQKKLRDSLLILVTAKNFQDQADAATLVAVCVSCVSIDHLKKIFGDRHYD